MEASPHLENYEYIPQKSDRIVQVKIHSFDEQVFDYKEMRSSSLSFKMSIDGSPYTKFIPPKIPTLYDYSQTKVNRVDIKLGETVDFVFFNYDIDPHPYHVHG